ncbi:hypothetical protein [Aliarcobacter butzleri]|uniref:hypothetical protein n=1 Tax=Aliarcobacter butzleri TaxID=28197 RepID=UPI00344FBB68
MLPQIKEFFNTKMKEDELEENIRVKRNRMLGIFLLPENSEKEIPSINNFKAFINCNISPSICPMLWDELKDVDEGVKYCIYCEKSVYEVSSIKEYKQYLSQNKCMAVPYSLIDEHKQEVELSDIVEEDLEDMLKLSRFFIVARYLNSYNEKFISSTFSKELFLKNIICALIFHHNFEEELEKYLSHGVDMEFIFTKVCTRIEDKKFVDLVKKQIIEKEKWKKY